VLTKISESLRTAKLWVMCYLLDLILPSTATSLLI